jgi:hypothetical protein
MRRLLTLPILAIGALVAIPTSVVARADITLTAVR